MKNIKHKGKFNFDLKTLRDAISSPRDTVPNLESYSDFEDWLEDSEVCDKDISCEDGVCPDCNYEKYLEWVKAHGHCDQSSWDCPDEEDCPWKKGLFDFKG